MFIKTNHKVELVPWGVGAIVFVCLLLNGYEWKYIGITLNIERLLSFPLLILSIVLTLPIRRLILPLMTPILLFIFIVVSFYSSVTSDVMIWTLKMWVLFLGASLYYYSIIIIRTDPFQIFYSRLFLLSAVFLGPVIVFVYLFAFFNLNIPSFMEHWLVYGGGGVRARAGLMEPNLFGSFLVLPLLGILAINQRNRIWWWLLLLFLHISFVLSFSRVPWFAYVVALCLYFFLLSPSQYDQKKITELVIKLSLFMLLVAIVAYYVFAHYGHYEIIGRISSINTRFYMWNLAMAGIKDHPILGNGLFSLSQLHPLSAPVVGSVSFRSIWISNIFLAVLHDTGLVGFSLFFSFVFLVLKRGIKTIRRAAVRGQNDKRSIRIGAALVATGFSLVVTGQSIPSHSLGFFWLVFALIDRVSILLGSGKNHIIVHFS